MIPLFLGLTAANLLLLLAVFGIGLFTTDAQGVTTPLYPLHVALGIAAGLLGAFTHVSIYTYFMATTKWLQAATDKADLPSERFVLPALARKSRAFLLTMAAVTLIMVAMFAGAGADPSVNPLWPTEVHLLLATAAIVTNAVCAGGQYQLIAAQGRQIDDAAGRLGREPGLPLGQA